LLRSEFVGAGSTALLASNSPERHGGGMTFFHRERGFYRFYGSLGSLLYNAGGEPIKVAPATRA